MGELKTKRFWLLFHQNYRPIFHTFENIMERTGKKKKIKSFHVVDCLEIQQKVNSLYFDDIHVSEL